MADPASSTSHGQRQLAMLHAISRSLSGALSVHETIAQIAASARALLDFDRIAVIEIEGPDVHRVHASMNAETWSEGRLLRRSECSPRLWPDPARGQIIADTRQDLDPAFAMDHEVIERGIRSVLHAPLAGRDRPIGVLAFTHPEPDHYGENDLRTAEAIAGLVALALEHERLHRHEVDRRSRAAAIEAVLPEIAKAREHDEIVQTVARLSKPFIPWTAVAVGVLHSHGGRMHGVGPLGPVSFEVDPATIRQQLSVVFPTGYVRLRRMTVLDRATRLVRLDIARANEELVAEYCIPENVFGFMERLGIQSQLRVAIRQTDGPEMGALIFSSTEPDFYTEEHAEIAVRLGQQITLTLAHERIESETKKASEASSRAQMLEARVAELQRELEAARGPHAVVGVSKGWQDVLAQATRVAPAETTVLLTGESGTGKEVVARFVHLASKRAEGPFVAINCAALPEQLLEAELFGHEKGAFTGAGAARTGRIEQAQGGVLFLDEVGEMSPSVQAKFLRVLQEREFQRLGGSRTMKADVRIIAATNRDLKAMIARGDFREDLYYRLHVFAIALPPLRERPADVLALADHFCAELGNALGRGSAGMTAEARDVLQRHPWPGNARELRNVIERALILSDGALIHTDHLAVSVPGAVPAAVLAGAAADGVEVGLEAAGEERLPEEGIDLEAIERVLVERAMGQSAGNKSKAAKLLGLTRAQLYSRLEKYSL